MKKDEFLPTAARLRKEMDEELLTDILGDYENHFKEGMENGKGRGLTKAWKYREIRQAF